jgi:hypothetical protein
MSMRWFRDAFCDAEVAQARQRGVDPYLVMEEAAAGARPGGVIAVLSNVMNARRWTHASPSFLQFDLADPAGSGRGACVRAIEEAAAYVARGHRDIIGVVKYYLTEGRAQFNPLLHVVVPVIATAAGVVVVWKSYFSPFTSSGPVFWGLLVFFAIVAVTIVALIYMRVRGREEWMTKAQLVFEQSGTGH